MITKKLSTNEYESTVTERMKNVTGIEASAVDIWPYIQQLVNEQLIPETVLVNKITQMVYRNETGTFDHVLVPSKTSGVFIIIITDLINNIVKGHYRQDLNEIYGLT